MASPNPLRLEDIERLTKKQLRAKYDEAVAAAQPHGSADLLAFAAIYKNELNAREERRRHLIDQLILVVGIVALVFTVNDFLKQEQRPNLVLSDEAHRSLLGEPPPNIHVQGRVLFDLTNTGTAAASEIRIEARGEEGIGDIISDNGFPFDREVIAEGERSTVAIIFRIPDPLAKKGGSLKLSFHFKPQSDTSMRGIVRLKVLTKEEPYWQYLGGVTLGLRL